MEPKGPGAGKVTNDAQRVGVEIDVSDQAARLESEAMRLWNDLRQQGVSGKELGDRIRAGLMNLSDAPVNEAARGATTESFNLGRNLGAQDHAGAIARVVRTEILDDNTCDYCEEVDGTVVEMNSEEYFRLMPPNGCHGRDLCRGFFMYLTEAA
jgi:hypothetical protein